MKILYSISLLISSFVMTAQIKKYSYRQSTCYFIFAPEIYPNIMKGVNTQLAFKVANKIYVGGDVKAGSDPKIPQDAGFGKISLGGFTACKLPINNHLYVWGNVGYYITHTNVYSDSYYKGYGSSSVL